MPSFRSLQQARHISDRIEIIKKCIWSGISLVLSAGISHATALVCGLRERRQWWSVHQFTRGLTPVSVKMSVRARSIVVTGANRGLGLEMVRQLISSDTPPQHLFATCRDPDAATVRIDSWPYQIVVYITSTLWRWPGSLYNSPAYHREPSDLTERVVNDNQQSHITWTRKLHCITTSLSLRRFELTTNMFSMGLNR